MQSSTLDLLSAQQRLAEIAEILALGLIRLRSRKSSPLVADVGESLLDCLANQSGHAGHLLQAGGRE